MAPYARLEPEWRHLMDRPRLLWILVAANILLAFASMPVSLTLEPLYRHWPELFNKPFMQLAWTTICAATQSSILFLISWFGSKSNGQA